MGSSGRVGLKMAVQGHREHQQDLFDSAEPEWVEVNIRGVRTERTRDFGVIWLALELLRRLGLLEFFRRVLPRGRENISWADVACALIIARLCNPKSELYIAKHFYGHTALADLIGIATDKIYNNRLYPALDKLLPHKKALETHLTSLLRRALNCLQGQLSFRPNPGSSPGQAR